MFIQDKNIYFTIDYIQTPSFEISTKKKKILILDYIFPK